jgi:heterodisulfide reductase subunit A
VARRIGFFICECGPNIGEAIDIDAVLNAVDEMEDVVLSAKFGLLCSGPGKEFVRTNIVTEKLTHLVVAACSPKQHELTFMDVCDESGINPFLFQLANIREQVAWVTKDKEEATDKAIRLAKAAIRRVRYHDPLSKTSLEVNADVLVVGGGVAGMTAALRLASPERLVHLVQRATALGGWVATAGPVYPTMEDGGEVASQLVQQVEANDRIIVHTDSEVTVVVGFFGNFEVVITCDPEEGATKDTRVNVGAVVVATGADALRGEALKELGHGSSEGVVTSDELETMLADGTIGGKGGKGDKKGKGSKAPKRFAFIQCVGRDEVGYCSEVCCMSSAKLAKLLVDRVKGAKVHVLYRDLCVPGRDQQSFIEGTVKAGVKMVRATSVAVEAARDGITVSHSVGDLKPERLEVDMLVLSPALVPSEGMTAVANMLNVEVDDSGFLLEAHEKLDPMVAGIDGIYLAGSASGPRSLGDSIVQAEACAGRLMSSLIPGRTIEPEIRVSHILETLCNGCQSCLEVCCYGAIVYDARKNVSRINAAICRGCGNCVAACPSNAITLYHFTYKQLYQEIEEAVR